jgi:hypothetical protein
MGAITPLQQLAIYSEAFRIVVELSFALSLVAYYIVFTLPLIVGAIRSVNQLIVFPHYVERSAMS